jgi:hypothetical protein
MSDPVDRNGVTCPVPQNSTTLVVSKHRRIGSGPGPISNDVIRPGTSGTGRSTGTRPLPKPLTELRPSSASRPVTSDSAEHRRKGSLFLGWIKGSHNKDAEIASNGNAALYRSMTEKSKSALATEATMRTGLGLSVNNDAVIMSKLDDEPDWRARRRSRRMA